MQVVLIYFLGLISHLTLDGPKQVAAIIYEEHHIPQLIVNSGAVLKASKKRFPTLAQGHPDELDRIHFDLSGVGRIEIVGLVEGGTARTPEFENSVYSLKRLGVTELAQGAKDEDPAAVNDDKRIAFAYVDLTGGTLSVAGCFKKMGKLDKVEATDHCIPSRTLFTGYASSTVLELKSQAGCDGPCDMLVNASAEMIIANLPVVDEAAGRNSQSAKPIMGHFKEHAKVGKGSIPELHESNDDCRSKPVVVPSKIVGGISVRGDTVECTNTHFP